MELFRIYFNFVANSSHKSVTNLIAMATVSIIHNISYKSKNNLYPVVFVIRNKGTHAHISTGIKIGFEFWDNKRMIKKNTPGILDHKFTNADLLRKQGDIQIFITKLTQHGDTDHLTAAQIKSHYINNTAKEKYNFNTYFEYVISLKSKSTAKIYQHTYNLIKKYHKEPLSFSEVNPRFLREFETWHNKSINGTAIHFRNIRAVFNTAIDDEVISLELYPFRRFKIRKEETKKRNITIKQVKALNNIELFGVPQLSRDIFMLIFYLIGINLKDLTYLPKSAVKGGRIQYKRLKTGEDYNIKLEPEAKKLIKKLSGKKYLINLAEHYQNYDSIKKEINKKLKIAALKAGISEPISTYYARHSWATIAHNIDISDETIAEALGHKSPLKTTSIYIEKNHNKVDIANRKVLDELI